MYIPIREVELDDGVSVVTRGAVVLAESVICVKNFLVTYRLSIEPRLQIREDDGERYYTVTVEKQKNGMRTRACLRDFTERLREAESFYRRLVTDAVLPEHLSDMETG